MKTPVNTLPTDVETLQELVLKLQSQVSTKQNKLDTLQSKYQYLLEQFRLAQHQQFGRSSETHATQDDLFNEAEALFGDFVEPEKESISYTRNKPKRKPLPKDLPREVIIHDINEADKVCDCCGNDLHQMGEDKSEQLQFVPAQIKVIEHIRLKYSCRTCEQSATKTTLKIAPVPTSPIPKSIATPSLLSQIITSKYQFSLPLYRQEMFFKQHGIEINRKTMSEWMIKCATLFKPIIDIFHEHLLQQSVVQADETPLKVLKEDKSTCYMWLYCSGTDSARENNLKNIVLYDYQNSRSGRCAVNYLQGFTGALQVDGYKGYEQTNAQLSGCWAHARRKFTDAQKAQGHNKAGKAQWAINHIQKLYRIEKLIEGKSAEEKVAIRREQALPLLEQFRTWLDKSALQVPPKSAVGKAIAYNLNQWQKLVRYVENGDLNIDNNRAERAIKPFVIGRKNWLFSNSASGANASAVLYSVIETAKANGLTPFNYLMHLLEELPKEPDDLEPLLPWNVELEQKI